VTTTTERLGDTDLIRITNARGSSISLIPLGARLVRAEFPDRDGRLDDLVLGFDSAEAFLASRTYAGAVAGRCANRIAGGRFTLHGRDFTLETNEDDKHLHGGFDGLDRQVWDHDVDGDAVVLRHTSPAGHGGYPGELAVTVRYALGADDTLAVDLTATTTEPTIVNLVQHAYWNLAGHASGSVYDQVLQLSAPAYTPVDDALLPTGEIRLVEGTPFDFRAPRPIGDGAYDHNWVLDGARGELHPAAVAVDPASGRRLTLHTTEPGVQVYTGGYLDDLPGKDGAVYAKGAGFTLETQTFPAAATIPWFPSPVLEPGGTYRHAMRFAFDTV
jgi:aldose 1-epimerase